MSTLLKLAVLPLLLAVAGCTTATYTLPQSRVMMRAMQDVTPTGVAPGTGAYYLVEKGTDGNRVELVQTRRLIYGGRPMGFRREAGRLVAFGGEGDVTLHEPPPGGYIAWAREEQREYVFLAVDSDEVAEFGVSALKNAVGCNDEK
ncbi:MAG: hypothetical protein ACFCVE_01100 [Phycisphaerae bacterium]